VIIPTVLVRNEEYHIAEVLHALVDVFGMVIMGDTGSLDLTPRIAAEITGVQVHQFGVVTPRRFTELRAAMGELAARAGADWQLLCDGDELYSRAGLQAIRDMPMPVGTYAGFTSMMTLDRDDDGDLWEMNDQFSRLAVMPARCGWSGDYPFDVPDVFNGHSGQYFYYPLPVGLRYHAVHLHRLPRSTEDSITMMRVRKQKQFSMQERPDIMRTEKFNLKFWEEM